VLLDCLTSDEVYPHADARYIKALRDALRNFDIGDRVMNKGLDRAILGPDEAL
jgi:hypothetical protein